MLDETWKGKILVFSGYNATHMPADFVVKDTLISFFTEELSHWSRCSDRNRFEIYKFISSSIFVI